MTTDQGQKKLNSTEGEGGCFEILDKEQHPTQKDTAHREMRVERGHEDRR